MNSDYYLSLTLPELIQEPIIGAIIFCSIIATIAFFLILRQSAKNKALASTHSQEKESLKLHLESLTSAQSELTGRMQTMAEVFSERHTTLNKNLGERLDGIGHKLGQTMSQNTQNTHQTLRALHERLATIDNAQKNITELSQGVVELQTILSNKQSRGAFGQGRMEAIIADALPKSSYAFQVKLSNNKQPDCLVYLPNNAPPLAIDAKFPLEAWNALRDLDDNSPQRGAIEQRFKADMMQHVKDISNKYLLQGETHDTAFMFVPSESIFADLHEFYEDIIEKAGKLRVVIVSPSLLLLSIQVVQVIMRDARLREQAHLIQGAVGKLMEDVNRLDERVEKLSNHFGQAQKDIDLIQTSTSKIKKHGDKIADFDVQENIEQGRSNETAPNLLSA